MIAENQVVDEGLEKKRHREGRDREREREGENNIYMCTVA